MRKLVKVIAGLVICSPLLFIGGCFLHLQFKWAQFDSLEVRAKRVITAAELQSWATNVIVESEGYSADQWFQLRTNCPAKLRSVSRWIGGPHVSMVPATEPVAEEQTDGRPAYMLLGWSIKPSGDARFEIGPTNFVSIHSEARAWAPGVYFIP